MKAGTGETRAITASQGLTPISSATIETNVSAVWTRPNAPEIMATGRLAESVCARRRRS